MSEDRRGAQLLEVAERMSRATNAHDVDALTDCFTSDYRSIWPLHPARSFSGIEQVRSNWQQIFGAVPDVSTRIVGSAVGGDTLWTEWEFTGTRRDGESFLMRGVVIYQIDGDKASEARFFLEPVEDAADDPSAAVRRLVGAEDDGLHGSAS